MQLIVAGASGYLASEVIRQALSHPKITSVIALARRKVEAPTGTDGSKLKSVIVKDYDFYGEDVKNELGEAGACIWTVAVTPSKSKSMDFDTVRKVCLEDTMLGLKTISEARREGVESLRFVYVSGAAAERDQSKKPSWMPEYSLMRGETENRILDFAKNHNISPCIVKPGLITNGGILKGAFAMVMKWTGMVGSVSIQDIAAVMLEDVVQGINVETLENEDL
ncbi:hypothetical protein FKW77_003457, partial [Venturia effusa]